MKASTVQHPIAALNIIHDNIRALPGSMILSVLLLETVNNVIIVQSLSHAQLLVTP